ncbi:Fe-S cluster assembly protein SufD [soil metagenome]
MDDITIKDLTEEGVLALSSAYGEPEWLRDRRLEAFKAFSDLEWPHRRVEEWRYTDPARFDLERVVRTDGGTPAPRTAGVIVAAGDLDGSVAIVDGEVRDAMVCAEAAERGVVVTDMATAARDHAEVVGEALGSAAGTTAKFDALSLAAFTGSVVVIVPPDVELARPIGVRVHATGDGAFLPRVLVIAGRHAKAILYVDHSGDGQATVVETIEAVLAEGAHIDLVTAQDWGDHVDGIANHTGLVGRQASYRHLEVTLGGRIQYVRPDVHLVGEGGNGELLGVYFTDEGQHVEHRSLIHHDASHTTSNTVYKGALQGRSRAVWYGNVMIEAHAKQVAADETNRNLIMSDGARADSIPFLEIKTSDVASCGHHSSIGQVDAAQLFYLESRGISREEAAKLLVFGFFAEITDRIDLPGVRETVTAELEAAVTHGPTSRDPRRG